MKMVYLAHFSKKDKVISPSVLEYVNIFDEFGEDVFDFVLVSDILSIQFVKYLPEIKLYDILTVKVTYKITEFSNSINRMIKFEKREKSRNFYLPPKYYRIIFEDATAEKHSSNYNIYGRFPPKRRRKKNYPFSTTVDVSDYNINNHNIMIFKTNTLGITSRDGVTFTVKTIK